MASYNHQSIEKKWQAIWEQTKVGRVIEEKDRAKDALYFLTMFPYPSGAGLHVGHVESYTAVDILARFERMCGKHVMMPIGYDAFGLPAENYAVKTGIHPSETTNTAITNFRRQMKSVGLSFDWDREFSTADPAYYKWTQWLFLKLFESGLAYKRKAPVNWCPKDQTVLANEQVVNGACERCGTQVIQKELEQWFFGITKFADRLLDGLAGLDWPEKIKTMQRNWIGKSDGAEIAFALPEGKEIRVFTTRPDTLMGVSYIVLAPEHALVDELTVPEKKKDIEVYRVAARAKSELERTQLEKDKSGVFTGSFATHPITGEPVQVWVSDYVLTSYGTGAVMGVPAHDERDFLFAKKYKLQIKEVISSEQGISEAAYTDSGILVNSGAFDGLTSDQAKEKIVEMLEKSKLGASVTKYRLRDWLVSRQRYWGAPIPIVYDPEGKPHAVKAEHLPLELPTDVDYTPRGTSPLGSSKSYAALAEKLYGTGWHFEIDTMDTFVDSSWYYLRYCDPKNETAFADKSKIDFWCPVDLYVGGAEHAVMHLLYSRFFAYALSDAGLISFEEPFPKLRNQGLILDPQGEKMSKSKGNVVNPDELVMEYGADALRMYEMFMGPFEDAKPWDTKGVVGVRRFLDKVAHLRAKTTDATNTDAERALHKTIKRVTEDLQAFKFNTVVSQLMICTNTFLEAGSVSRDVLGTYLVLLSPLAPHLAEELWAELGNTDSIFAQTWPSFDPALVKDNVVAVAIQVNGKLRGTIQAAPDLAEAEAVLFAAAEPNVARHLEGKAVLKTIYKAGKMVNFVVKE